MLICQLFLSIIVTVIRIVFTIVREIVETVCGWVHTTQTIIYGDPA